MSASNWAICPRCNLRHEREAERLRAETDAEFGKISIEDWRVKDAAAYCASDPFTDTAFREDYEIFGAEEGTVRVNYSGECTVCGLSLNFKHAVPIQGLDQ